MTGYEERAYRELVRWQLKMNKKPSVISKYTKKTQDKINSIIPEKVHEALTASIKHMIQATLAGSEYTKSRPPLKNLSLEEREKLVREKVATYKKVAALEGAGTGAGGILLGLADFPLLLGIKMKFLFEAANSYGFDVSDYRERLFILHLFQLAFANETKRQEIYEIVANWEEREYSLTKQKESMVQFDWRVFQQEYRDNIDLVKMLQMIPGLGAIVGTLANYHFLKILGETAMNGYRLRWFKKWPPKQ